MPRKEGRLVSSISVDTASGVPNFAWAAFVCNPPRLEVFLNTITTKKALRI